MPSISGTAGNAVNDNSAGDVAWISPEEAESTADGIPAIGIPSGVGQTSNFLLLTHFPIAIPAGAMVVGVEVIFTRRGPEVEDEVVRLINGSGSIVGDNKATTTNWPASFDETTYGGPTDDWAAGLADTDINSVNFGVALRADFVDFGMMANSECDACEVVVYYAVAEESAAIMSMRSTLAISQP